MHALFPWLPWNSSRDWGIPVPEVWVSSCRLGWALRSPTIIGFSLGNAPLLPNLRAQAWEGARRAASRLPGLVSGAHRPRVAKGRPASYPDEPRVWR
jgi:hypothetical protein